MKYSLFFSNRNQALFYRLINIESVNSLIKYMSYIGTITEIHFDFIKTLAHVLIIPHFQKRLPNTPNLPRKLKSDIEKILGSDYPLARASVPDDRVEKRKTLAIYPPGSDRKTKHK